jgi:hypothetical protein
MVLHVSITIGNIKRVELDSLKSLSRKEKKHVVKVLSGRLIHDVDALPDEIQLKIKDEALGVNPDRAKRVRKYKPRNLCKYKLELEFRKIRGNILERDDYTCQNCGARRYLHVHHKKPLSEGGDNSNSNLITLCKDCHKKEHAREPVVNIM